METKTIVAALFLSGFAFSCNTYEYIHDETSRNRQKEIHSSRAGNVTFDVMGCMSSAFLTALLDTEIGFEPSEKVYKRIKLINPSADTMYVNMLTDANWKNEEYCDFNDVRIPPGKTCKLLVPIGINYNLYFGNTENPENDKKIEVNTATFKKINLTPELIKKLEGE